MATWARRGLKPFPTGFSGCLGILSQCWNSKISCGSHQVSPVTLGIFGRDYIFCWIPLLARRPLLHKSRLEVRSSQPWHPCPRQQLRKANKLLAAKVSSSLSKFRQEFQLPTPNFDFYAGRRHSIVEKTNPAIIDCHSLTFFIFAKLSTLSH